MRLIRYLTEEFAFSVKIRDYRTKEPALMPIFVNPSTSDIKEILKDYARIRGIIDFKKKQIYIWAAELAVHADVKPQIAKEYGRLSVWSEIYCKVQNFKLRIISGSFYGSKDEWDKMDAAKDYSWLRAWLSQEDLADLNLT